MDRDAVEGIRERYQSVLELIAHAAQSAGRDPASVRLVLVTKTHPLEVIRAAVAAGARRLGENYAAEALEKITALADPNLEWHMIGHVQSRKADVVARNFALVHSLDSFKLAEHLQRSASAAGRRLAVLLECNVSGEQSKFGLPAWDPSQRPALHAVVESILGCPALDVRGLMTMPPYFSDPAESRPYFARLRALQEDLANAFPQARWAELSMGTSADFQAAVLEGATLVRVGTAVLGERTSTQVR